MNTLSNMLNLYNYIVINSIIFPIKMVQSIAIENNEKEKLPNTILVNFFIFIKLK
jgi:hypothetical protein